MQTRITQDNLRRLIYIRDLLRELVVRDMKLRYKRSVLGVAWSILNPLAQLLVFGFVFRFILPVKIPNYSSFLFCGVLAWNWFSSSLLLSTGAIVDNRDLIKRPGFPAAIQRLAAACATTNAERTFTASSSSNFSSGNSCTGCASTIPA